MDSRQKKRLSTRFGPPPPGTTVISLDIADRFEFMANDLVNLLKIRLAHHFGPLGTAQSLIYHRNNST